MALVDGLTAETFLPELYARILDHHQSQGGQAVLEYLPQEIYPWRTVEGSRMRSEIQTRLDLRRAVLIHTSTRIEGIALGEELDAEVLQFGQLGSDEADTVLDRILRRDPVQTLRVVVGKKVGSFGYGSFSRHLEFGTIDVHCWADSRTHGGWDVDSWKPERLFTTAGLDACVAIVARTSRNAFY